MRYELAEFRDAGGGINPVAVEQAVEVDFADEFPERESYPGRVAFTGSDLDEPGQKRVPIHVPAACRASAGF